MPAGMSRFACAPAFTVKRAERQSVETEVERDGVTLVAARVRAVGAVGDLRVGVGAEPLAERHVDLRVLDREDGAVARSGVRAGRAVVGVAAVRTVLAGELQ